MKADKPNFTDSELYLIETIILEDEKKFKTLTSKGEHEFTDEMLLEYKSILDKLKKWRTEEHNWYKSIDSLVKTGV